LNPCRAIRNDKPAKVQIVEIQLSSGPVIAQVQLLLEPELEAELEVQVWSIKCRLGFPTTFSSELRFMTKISIIVPAYNEAELLPGLVSSVREVMPASIDIIVVDNGSTDGTSAVATRLGCRLVQIGRRTYPSVARNRGAEVSDADVLVFLDADTTVTASWASEILRLAQDASFMEGGILTGNSCHISTCPSWIERYWFEPLRHKKSGYINGANIAVSRKGFRRIGGFNPMLESGEDVEFSRRATERGLKVVQNPKLVVHHEGFPKDLANFFKREQWHGRGDFANFSFFKKSPVAQIAVLIGLCDLLIALALPIALISGSLVFSKLVLAAAGLALAVCGAVSLLKFRRFGLSNVVLGTFIYFIYFNARLTAIFPPPLDWESDDSSAATAGSADRM
jgi:glycosyltransferase involved in cell wall biosynthesis